MRILVVSNFFPSYVVGGAEIVAHRYAVELKKRGHHVAVFAGRLPDSERDVDDLAIEETDSITVYRTVLRSLEPDDSFFWPAAANRLRSIVEIEKIDIVHFHNIMGLGVNLIPKARDLGLKTVVTLHDHWGFCLKNTRLRDDNSVCGNFEECDLCLSHFHCREIGQDLPVRLRRDYVAWCLEQADILVSPSRYLAGAYEEAGIGKGRVQVQSNGINLARFRDINQQSADKVRFTMIGYLGEHKGLFLLLKAVKILCQHNHLDGKWHLRIVGGGYLEQWLIDEIVRQGFEEHVEFLGKLPAGEMIDVYASTDIVLLPSIWPENEPVVLLEAIATCKAQLASRIGGNTELVEDEKSGLLFEPGNAMALADAMVRYIEEPSMAARHGAWNKERRESFDEYATVDRYEHYFQDAMCAPVNKDKNPLVICDGEWPTLQLTQLINNYAILSVPHIRVRLVHAKHTSPADWHSAAALWVWSKGGGEVAVRHALRAGLAIVAPHEHEIARGLEAVYGCARTYENILEAAAILNIITREDKLEKLQIRCPETAVDLIVQIADSGHFSQLTKDSAV